MRTTITLDDELLEAAGKAIGTDLPGNANQVNTRGVRCGLILVIPEVEEDNMFSTREGWQCFQGIAPTSF